MLEPKRKLSLRQVLDRLERVEVSLSSVIRRWNNGVAPEVRAEIATEAYAEVLDILIRNGRRPTPR